MEPIDQPISNVVDFKTFSYFPLTWRLAAIIFIVSGIFLTPLNMFLGIGMVIGGVLVMTTH